jgi:hypothetical protein
VKVRENFYNIVQHECWRAAAGFSTNNRRRNGSHLQRDDISKLKEKIESACYQVTQRGISKRPRLQNLQSMFKIK